MNMIRSCSILFFIMLLLCSCSKKQYNDFLDTLDESRIANRKCAVIIEALKTRDSNKLKSVFSKQSLRSISDFEYKANDLFDFFDANVVSIHQNGSGPFVEKSFDKNHREENQISDFIIECKTNTYSLLLNDQVVDTRNSNNIGLISIILEYEKQKDNYYHPRPSYTVSDIYCLKW